MRHGANQTVHTQVHTETQQIQQKHRVTPCDTLVKCERHTHTLSSVKRLPTFLPGCLACLPMGFCQTAHLCKIIRRHLNSCSFLCVSTQPTSVPLCTPLELCIISERTLNLLHTGYCNDSDLLVIFFAVLSACHNR